MIRCAIAALLLATLGTTAAAQMPVPIKQPPPGPGAPLPTPTPVTPTPATTATPPVPATPGVTGPLVIPVLAGKPAAGFYKSGGVLVGADGNFPFDTGAWLLGGTDGLTRQFGTFHMVPVGGDGFGSFPTGTARFHRLFHHR